MNSQLGCPYLYSLPLAECGDWATLDRLQVCGEGPRPVSRTLTCAFRMEYAKARNNLGKHGVSPMRQLLFSSTRLALTFSDADHWAEEEREITVGLGVRRRVVLVSHCQRGQRTRIISARGATRREQNQYEEGITWKAARRFARIVQSDAPRSRVKAFLANTTGRRRNKSGPA